MFIHEALCTGAAIVPVISASPVVPAFRSLGFPVVPAFPNWLSVCFGHSAVIEHVVLCTNSANKPLSVASCRIRLLIRVY